MSERTAADRVNFDDYGRNYAETLNRSLAPTGETVEYFARGRVAWLAARLAGFGPAARPRRVIDFGCGTGNAVPWLRSLLGADDILGVDTSGESLSVARERHAATGVRFLPLGECAPAGDADLVFASGVFHHVPPRERPAALAWIRQALRPGGWFALWDHNSWHPGTRWIVSRTPFDRDAVLLSPLAGRALAREAGFRVRGLDFLFVFPRVLAALRPLEPALAALPLGAQFQLLAQRPD